MMVDDIKRHIKRRKRQKCNPERSGLIGFLVRIPRMQQNFARLSDGIVSSNVKNNFQDPECSL